MSSSSPLVVVGATNLIAPYLIERLRALGRVAEVLSRQQVSLPEGFVSRRMDLETATGCVVPQGAVVLSLIPLWLLAKFLPRFAGAQAIIAVGSTSVFSKAESVSASEQGIAAQLQKAERDVIAWCAGNGATYTLLRPTLVYDGHGDKNIARMVRFIRWFYFLPLAAPASGLRQPIHADDVAGAIAGAINNDAAANKAFNIAGGEVLPYRVMAERVFAALGKPPRFLMLPTRLLMKAFGLAESLGVLREKSFGNAIFQRMNQNLIFDVADGLQVLDYKPREFRPKIL